LFGGNHFALLPWQEQWYSSTMHYPLNNLMWIEDLLPPGYDCAPKHGGMAYYFEGKLVLILVELHDGGNEHKGVVYPFEIWNGCILPIEYKKQNAFFLKFSFLENHPANKDWLYIPADTEDFEDQVKQYLKEIMKGNPLLGTPVKFKSPKPAKDANALDETAKPKRKAAAKVKTDKKDENKFLLGMLSKKIK
jgi:hypothetical protein